MLTKYITEKIIYPDYTKKSTGQYKNKTKDKQTNLKDGQNTSCWTTYNYVSRCSISVIIGKTQIVVIMRQDFIPIR